MIEKIAFQIPALREIYEYWVSKCRNGRLPSRADIKPKELGRLLPYIFLVDVLAEPPGFRFRLVGTQLTHWAAQDYKGFVVHEFATGPARTPVFRDFQSVVQARAPLHNAQLAPWLGKDLYRFERIVAPLSSDGHSIDVLLGGAHTVA